MKFKIGQKVKTHVFESTENTFWNPQMLKNAGKTGTIDECSEEPNSYRINRWWWPESALTLVGEKREPDSYPGDYYQPLFDVISQELNVNPTLSDMDEIIRVVEEMQKAKSDEVHPEPVPFDLERALKGDQVVTREGQKVGQLRLFNVAGDDKPLVGVVSGYVNRWTKEGKWVTGLEDGMDLFMVPQKKEYWVNVWMDKDGEIFTGEKTYRSKEDAESCIRPDLIKVGVSLVHEEIV